MERDYFFLDEFLWMRFSPKGCVCVCSFLLLKVQVLFSEVKFHNFLGGELLLVREPFESSTIQPSTKG